MSHFAPPTFSEILHLCIWNIINCSPTSIDGCFVLRFAPLCRSSSVAAPAKCLFSSFSGWRWWTARGWWQLMNLIELLCELCIARPSRGPRVPGQGVWTSVSSSLCARARAWFDLIRNARFESAFFCKSWFSMGNVTLLSGVSCSRMSIQKHPIGPVPGGKRESEFLLALPRRSFQCTYYVSVSDCVANICKLCSQVL